MTLEEPPAALSSWGFEDFYDPPIEVKSQTCDVVVQQDWNMSI
jgi:hypothetical protein